MALTGKVQASEFNNKDPTHQQYCDPRSRNNHEGSCEHEVTRWEASSDSGAHPSIITVPNYKSIALIFKGYLHRLNCALRR